MVLVSPPMEDKTSPGDGSVIPESGTTVIRFPNWIGDAVMATAGLQALRVLRPEIRLVGVVKPWVEPVFRHDSALDDLIVYDPGKGVRRGSDFLSCAGKIKGLNPVAAVLFQTAFESALMMFAARVPIRIGFPSDHRRFLLTQSVNLTETEKNAHQVGFYLAITRAAAGDIPGEFTPVVHPGTDAESRGEDIIQSLPGKGPVVAIAPGAAFGAAKCWLPEHYAAVTSALVTDQDIRVVFIGGPGERSLMDKIRDLSDVPFTVLAGKEDLLVQAAVIARSELCIANDSGLMHLAAALSTPVVAIFGPTSPEATGPFGPDHQVIHHPVDCWPCKHRECPVDHRCMTAITPGEVLEAIKKTLHRNKKVV